jgi:hypothetical protein
VVHRVVEHVFEGLGVLLVGLDHNGVEAASEDVVAARVALVERPGVPTIEVAHSLGEIRGGSFDDEVVVVAEQAARMELPAVPALDASQDLDEDGSVPVVVEDRLLVVSPRRDVVISASSDVAVRSSHAPTVAAAIAWSPRGNASGTPLLRPRYVPSTRHDGNRRVPRTTAPPRPRPSSARDAGARGSSHGPAAACAGTACPSASSPDSARPRRRARRPRSAPR